MKYTRIFLVACLLILLGTGCIQIETGPRTAEKQQTQNTWTSAGEYVDRKIIPFGSEQYDRLVLYRFKKDAYDWRFAYQKDPKPVSQWSTDESAAVVINGTYFHEDQLPSGVLIQNGDSIGERSFDQNRTGVINLQPSVEIIDTAAKNIEMDKLTSAAQSYPFLIKNGEPAIEKDSGLTSRRSFIGTDLDGNVFLGVVPSTRVSLYQLSRTLNKQDIDWKNVMNLDGGTSTGLAVRLDEWKETIDSMVPVPSAIIAKPVRQD